MSFSGPLTAEYFQVGLIVGRDADVGAATPAIQNEPGLDWMLNWVEFPSYSGATVDVQHTRTFDLRSKRRMHELNQRYLLTVFNSGVAGHTVYWHARTLVAMP